MDQMTWFVVLAASLAWLSYAGLSNSSEHFGKKKELGLLDLFLAILSKSPRI